MKIAIDGYDLTRQPTGVGRYLRNLLPEILAVDSRSQYQLFLRSDIDFPAQFPNLTKTIIPDTGGYSSWQNGPLHHALRRGAHDWLFAASNQLPVFFRGKSLLAVHDVAWRAIPQDFSFKERTGKDWKCRWALRQAARIYTDAEFGKSELIRYYRVKPEKIQAIPLAIEKTFQPASPAQIEAFKRLHRLEGKKIIGFLGSIFGRRHVRELLLAYAQLRKKHDLALFIIGKNFAGDAMTDLLRREGVIWLEWLPEEQLNSFYSALDLFVYISSYEGFGFPPLEALACGTAPLLLPSSSLREMYHDLALFVENPDPMQVTSAIDRFLDEPSADNARIRAAWQKRKDYFSWPRVAADYLQTLFK